MSAGNIIAIMPNTHIETNRDIGTRLSDENIIEMSEIGKLEAPITPPISEATIELMRK